MFNCLRWYGEAVDKIYYEIAPTADTALALITREPIGVVGGHRAVELSHNHGDLEDCTCTGGGQFGGVETQ